MGYDLGKRLSELRKQTDENLAARWRLRRTAFLCFLTLVLARYTLLPLVYTPSIEHAEKSKSLEEEEIEVKDFWIDDTKTVVNERLSWLSSSPLVLFPGTRKIYESIARSVDQSFTLSPESVPVEEENSLITFSDISLWWSRLLAGLILRFSFALLAFWPLWFVGIATGYFLMKINIKKRASSSILGVCDRGLGPFYSGIYGPYKPNHSFSGTELSCPSLACPKLETKEITEKHNLVTELKKAGAYSETNLELLRIILAHSDFPHYVAEENPIQAEETANLMDPENRVSKTGFVTNESGTLIEGVNDSLPCLLEAHFIAKNYISALTKNGLSTEELEKNFPTHVSSLKKASLNSSKLAQELLGALTPKKLWAIANIKSEVIAASYLAIEAGKALVYKRSHSGFTVISLYPHLQARAVIQSIPSYHLEHDGDTRLIVRQAIISSRRHGDFGRSFLPIKMPIESRAIRDWLEILYAEEDRREEISNLVELDGHMEEIHINFRNNFSDRMKNDGSKNLADHQHPLWKGLVYKSVLLIPLDEIVSTALKEIHPFRLEKISALLNLTGKFQARISTSARLPGFKRQAMEADKSGEEVDHIVRKIKEMPNGNAIYENWRIVRRMLTRYNWLSTRIGDDSVPLVGVIHGILKQDLGNSDKKYLSMDALVPLRERRFTEILGRNWENTFYRYCPYQDNVDTFTQTAEYESKLKILKAEPAPSEIKSQEKVAVSA